MNTDELRWNQDGKRFNPIHPIHHSFKKIIVPERF